MGLEARDKSFYLDGKKIVLLSGAIHYFRVVPEYWEDRLLRLKACGLNCVETYVPWNLHEEIRGEFNFKGRLDIRQYIETAKRLGLFVIFRPGPFICAEWDFGGLPSWLLKDPEMKVRSSYKPYLAAVDTYFSKLLPLVEDLQYSSGGPIIAVQVENEYGSYGNDLEYKTFLKKTLRKYGILELLFTSDNGMGIQTGEVPGELVTCNFQEKEHGYLMFQYLNNVKQPGMPLMVMEFWSGWFDHWSDKHQVWPLENFEQVLKWILEQGSSVNFYMFHGGTNFGFMSGANEEPGATNEKAKEPYAADVTSYDYDAPVSENGDLTFKYFKIRDLFQKMFPEQVPATLPEPPQSIPAVAYGELQMTSHIQFDDALKGCQGLPSPKVLPMEFLDINKGGGQSFGFVLYRTKVTSGSKVKLSGQVRDRAIVLLDGREVDVVDCTKRNHVTNLNLAVKQDGVVLDILVENCGRVNYANVDSPLLNQQRKGLTEPVLVDGQEVTDWTIYPLEFKADFLQWLSESASWSNDAIDDDRPRLCRTHLNVTGSPADTYINMKGWTKGVVFINAFNLGRYWNIGPQETLYIPGPLLKEGKNEIVIFELHKAGKTVTLEDRPRLGEPEHHKTVIPGSMKAQILGMKAALSLGDWVWVILKKFVK